MALVINDIGGTDRWMLDCLPNSVSDILVRVRAIDPVTTKAEPIFTFSIGELFREELEYHGTPEGRLILSESLALTMARWAAQLEAHAATIRAALPCALTPQARDAQTERDRKKRKGIA